MDKVNRQERIQQILVNENFKTFKELADELNVSEMTVRRDISVLDQQKLVNIYYGGVTLNTKNSTPASRYIFDNEIIERIEQKSRIAKKAASLIEPNDVILIDTGSTTRLMMGYLPDNINFIVYSYSLTILNEITKKENVKVVGCGGYFHENTRMFESEEGASLIKKTHLNKAFMAARGVTDIIGVTTAESYEVSMKQAGMEASEQKILLADSSKFGKAWYSKYASLDQIDILITDTDIKDEHRKMIEGAGITVYIV